MWWLKSVGTCGSELILFGLMQVLGRRKKGADLEGRVFGGGTNFINFINFYAII